MKYGFTLVELSIVLVIIGLLIGGILSAQSMISTTKVNSQARQFQQYDIATTNFYNKYKQIPGDCINTLCGGNPDTTGNGAIESAWWTGYASPPTQWWFEPAGFFWQLSIFGDIKETYSIADGCLMGEGGMWPNLKIAKGGISISGDRSGSVYYITISNAKLTVCNSGPYTDLMIGGVLNPAEAMSLDTKMDDGNPGTGEVASITTTPESDGHIGTPFVLDTANTATSCTTGGAAYNAGSSARACFLSIKSKYN